MTQPVQEPTQGRMDQAQEFRTRQLFRRPAPPAAAAGADLPYMVAAVDDVVLTSYDTSYLPMDTGSNRSRTSDAAMFATQSDGIVVQSDGLFAVTLNVRNSNGDDVSMYVLAYSEESDDSFVAAYQSVWGLTHQCQDFISCSYAHTRYIGLFSIKFTGAAVQTRFFGSVEETAGTGSTVEGKSLSVVKLSSDGTGLLTSLDWDI